MRAHARIRIRCERVQCEHMRMRAFASHCMRTHFSCVMRALAYVIWASSVSVMRAYARIRMRCERIRIACARIRIACARIACECAHLRGTYACPVLYVYCWSWNILKELSQYCVCRCPCSKSPGHQQPRHSRNIDNINSKKCISQYGYVMMLSFFSWNLNNL